MIFMDATAEKTATRRHDRRRPCQPPEDFVPVYCLWIGLGYSSVCTRMNGNALKDSGSGSLTARIRLRRLKRTTEQLVRSILRGTIDYLS